MKVIIYGIRHCVFCNRAKELCQMKGIEYQMKEMGSDISKSELEEMVGGSIKSAPQTFIDYGNEIVYVGGFTDLEEKLMPL